ncbi:unnamed protein product [Darwinula stevensoni]|uniref:TRUD domain-containing protein n=1 Tax=Darwinula stevensoni TaxID=69355 RepID=A0A7R8X7M3_9CRUS|nr:unnamed protein product [Darwinula stevensoni]CAG0888856.1 unnamed protein product [Darwinula stevensoni]
MCRCLPMERHTKNNLTELPGPFLSLTSFPFMYKLLETMESSKRALELDPEKEVKRIRVTSEVIEDCLKKDATLPSELDEGKESVKSHDNKSSELEGDKAVVWIKEDDVGISAFLGDHPGFMAFIKQRLCPSAYNRILLQPWCSPAMNQPYPLTKEQVRLLLLYDFRIKKKAANSIADINTAFGPDTVSKSTAYDWYSRFQKGNESLEDQPRTGRPSEFDNSALQEALEANNRQTSRELADLLGVSHTTILHHLAELGKKAKISDFQVYEQQVDGKIVHLTDLNPPEDMEDESPLEGQDVSSAFPKAAWDEIQKVAQGNLKSFHLSVEGIDKEARKTMHLAIKQCHANLETKTEDIDGIKSLTVELKNSNSRKDHGRWKRNRPKHTHFYLYKENIDTVNAVRRIASMLRTKEKHFGYAGVKDKRGKTVQTMSVAHITAERLAAISKGLQNMTLGNYSYKTQPILLGDLQGNQFHIILREVQGEKDIVESSLQSLKNNGFINYFGMQRFGSTEIPTHEVGKAILSSNWKEAVELILKPRNSPRNDHFMELNQARKTWWETRDAKKALEALKSKKYQASLEGSLLGSLAKEPNNYFGALDKLPRHMRLMYAHAYQSYVWNVVVTQRFQHYHDQVLPGDLICLDSSEPSPPLDEGAMEVEREEQEMNRKKWKKPKVRYVEEVEAVRTPITSVVFPLPGSEVLYPNNDMHTWLQETLAKDGFSLDAFRGTIHEKYHLTGAYRALVVKPQGFQWEHISYHEADANLLLSDLDRLRGRSLAYQGGERRGLVLRMTLRSSSYATVALRELTKRSSLLTQQRLALTPTKSLLPESGHATIIHHD